MCYACLFKLHWRPQKFLSLPNWEKAYIAAAFEVKGKHEEDEAKKIRAKSKASKGRR